MTQRKKYIFGGLHTLIHKHTLRKVSWNNTWPHYGTQLDISYFILFHFVKECWCDPFN